MNNKTRLMYMETCSKMIVYQLHRASKKSLSAQAIELIKEEKHEIATAIFA